MLILISPAKTQDFSEYLLSSTVTKPALLKDSQVLVEQLKKIPKGKLGKTLGVSAKLTELNFERFRSFKTPFTKTNAKPALLAFKGDVYQHIETEDYGKADFSFAQKHLRIISGLYGLLRPLDLMQAYRLEMKTKLKNSRGKNLYEFWGKRITKEVNKALKGSKTPILINLASNEYYKTIDINEIDGEVLTPVFKEKKAGNYKVVALFAKRARGMMTNYIIRNRVSKVEDLKKFRVGGYRYQKELSSKNELVFVR